MAGDGALMESGREYSECQPPLKNRDRQLLIQVRMKTTSHVHPGLEVEGTASLGGKIFGCVLWS